MIAKAATERALYVKYDMTAHQISSLIFFRVFTDVKTEKQFFSNKILLNSNRENTNFDSGLFIII